jgi:hypothetical protein
VYGTNDKFINVVAILSKVLPVELEVSEKASWMRKGKAVCGLP